MGNLIFAPARKPSLLRRASEPVWLATNGALFLATAAVQRGVKVIPGDEATLMSKPPGEKPTIFIAWHKHNYLLVQLMRHWPADRRPTLIMHDGLASRALTHESSVWMGFTTFVFARRGPKPPRQQIIDYMNQTGASIWLLPDAGGPYGVVKPGVVELSTGTGASVTPLSVRGEGTLKLGKTLQHELPWPGCTLSLRVGASIPASEVTQPRCQTELDAIQR